MLCKVFSPLNSVTFNSKLRHWIIQVFASYDTYMICDERKRGTTCVFRDFYLKLGSYMKPLHES